MNQLESIGLVLDASRAPEHRASALEQIKGKGRKAKVIGAGRVVGSTLLNRVYSGRVADSIPFCGELSERPIGYGVEAVVYRLTTNNADMAVKIFTKPGDPLDIIDSYKRHEESTASYLGDHLVPTNFILASHPFRSRTKIAVGIQEMIEGDNFFSNPGLADKADAVLFLEKIEHMQREINKVPDLSGFGNLLVAGCGSLRLVDAGFPISVGLETQDPFIQNRIDVLSSYATS